MPTIKKQALMVYNPSSGKKKTHKSFPVILKKLSELGYQLTIYKPIWLKNIDNPIKKACQNQWDAIFIAGGDGTIHHVIQYMAAEEYRPKIGVFPFGTSNEFAKYNGIPCNVIGALSVIEGGHSKPVGIGKMGDRYFANIAAAGWLTDITYKTSPLLKSYIGEWAYCFSFIRTLLLSRRPNTISIHISTDEVISDLALCLIMNGDSVGPLESLVKDNGSNDGNFHLITCKKTNRIHLLFSLLAIKLNIIDCISSIHYKRIKSCDFTLSESSSFNLDGERAQIKNLRFKVLPNHFYVFTSSKLPDS